MKKKRKISLKRAIGFEIINLIIIAAILFLAETKITERAQVVNLRERLDNLTETFDQAYNETRELTHIYNQSEQQKARSIAFYLDNFDASEININELKSLYKVEDILLGDMKTNDDGTYLYYRTVRKDGSTVTIKTLKKDLDDILNNVYTQNKILNDFVASEDIFFIITRGDGEILYYPEQEFIGKKIDSLGITQSDLIYDDAKWLRINKDFYYTSSEVNENLDITLSCGVNRQNMTKNSHIAVLVLYSIIAVIYTVVVLYTYYSRQEEQAKVTGYDKRTIRNKLFVFTSVGILLVIVVTFYVQSLFALSINTIKVNSLKREISAGLEESENSRSKLTEIYNERYLNKAQVIAHMLSQKPELRDKTVLKRLSYIYDLQYIMIFDKYGRETLSDSSIVGFVLSDDPDSQSYAFNVLKNGIPYVIQEAREDDLTKEYHQFIGVPLLNEEGEYDGFMQIAVSADKLKSVVEDTSIPNTIGAIVSGTNNKVLVLDPETKEVIYSGVGEYEGKTASDLGISDDDVKGRYFGELDVDGQAFYADSFEAGNKYIYVLTNLSSLYEGRITMTIFTNIVVVLNLIWFTFYMHDAEVDDLKRSDDSPYVDVTMASGDKKRTKDIVARVMRIKTMWRDKTPEEKTAIIVRIVTGVFAVIMVILYAFRNLIFTEDTILGFLINGRWERGLNILALTEALVFIALYSLVIAIINGLMDLIIKYVSPKNETLFRLLKSFVHYIGVITVVFYCLTLLGFDAQSLLASAGLLTLIVGLGAKDLITDVLAGLFIVFEKEFQVGDIIEINGYKGRVLEIGIRTTRIMNVKEDIKSINNRNLTNIVNKTRRNSYVDISLKVDATQDIGKIEQVLNEGLKEISKLSPYILDGPYYSGIDEIDGKIMKLAIRTECIEEHKFDVRTVVNKGIKELFEENDIKF